MGNRGFLKNLRLSSNCEAVRTALFASAVAPRGYRSRSRDCPDGPSGCHLPGIRLCGPGLSHRC